MPLTTTQVAKLLGLHEKSICRAARLGTLKAQRFARAFMITPADMRDYIERHPQPSTVAHVNVHSIV